MEKTPDVGVLLREARRAAKISQAKLAEALDIQPQQLSAWERKKEPIPERQIEPLLRKLPKLELKQLRLAMAARVASTIINDDFEATQQFRSLLAGRKGTVFVFSGKEAGFSNKELSDGAIKFLQDADNTVIFIVPPLTEDWDRWANPEKQIASDVTSSVRMFGGYSDLGEIMVLRERLADGNPDVYQRLHFYSLILPEGPINDAAITARLVCLSRLLHPLTVTMLFEPKSDSSASAGIIFIRAGMEKASKGEYAWIKPSSDFLDRLSKILRVTVKTEENDRKTFLRDLFEPPPKK
jgi:transcriptional regulator with XRE-family HTH domain